MKITCIASGSKGNAYLINDGVSTLLVECGVKLDMIKKATNYKLSELAGCLISHEHNDHAKCYKDLLLRGIRIFASKGTLEGIGIYGQRGTFALDTNITAETTVKTFSIRAFKVHHDAKEPTGFLIHSNETNENLLFITDSYYCDYSFKSLDYIMIECNYISERLEHQLNNPNRNPFVDTHIKRLMRSHMNLNTCIDFLKSCELYRTKEIMLLHLSDANADEEFMKSEVQKATGKIVRVF